MDAGWIVAILTAVAGLIGAGAAAAAGWRKGQQELKDADRKGRQDDERAEREGKKAETDDTIARYEKWCNRLEAHAAQQQEAIDQLNEEHSACQAQLAQLYVWLLRFRDASVRLCRTQGLDPEKELPEMPAEPRKAGGAEFRARTAKHNTGLIGETHRPQQPEGRPDGTAANPDRRGRPGDG